MKSILDRSFKYRSSVDTDLKATFARLRRAQSKKATAMATRSPSVKLVHTQLRNRTENA
jgi:hypothetical protein